MTKNLILESQHFISYQIIDTLQLKTAAASFLLIKKEILKIYPMKTKFSPQRGFIFVKAADNTDEKEALAMVEELEKYFVNAKKPLNFLVDVSAYKRSASKARFIMSDVMRIKMDQTGKIALYGNTDSFFMLAIKSVIALAGFTRCKVFETKEKALKWLEEKDI